MAESIKHANVKITTNVADASSSSPTQIVQAKPKATWKSYLWDTFDKPPEERRFLFKLDAALMTLASLGYFIKYLDQVCIDSQIWISNGML